MLLSLIESGIEDQHFKEIIIKKISFSNIKYLFLAVIELIICYAPG